MKNSIKKFRVIELLAYHDKILIYVLMSFQQISDLNSLVNNLPGKL
jgi:hypothetical protein